jgi:hypothetical protein
MGRNFFNEASSGTVTVQTVNSGGLRYAQNLSFSGFTGTFAGNSNAGLLVSGSLTLSTGMSFTYARNLYLAGSGTFTTAGKNIQGFTYVSGSGAIVSLGDAYNSNSQSSKLIIVEGGSFDTLGFAGSFGTISGTSGSLSLNSSTITLIKNGYTDPQALMLASGTNDTTRLNCSGGFNFYNVTFTASGGNVQQHLIEGPNNFNDLTFYAYNAVPEGPRFASLYLNDNTTVSGTLTCSGGSRVQRTFLSYGTSGTLSQFANPGSGIVVTVSSLNAPNCDFRDITLAGGASGASPSGAGDCGGNTGIVFPSPKTVYSVGSTTSFPGTGWATTSGGAGSLDNFPLAQDTAIINDDSTASSYYIFRPYNFGTLDFTNRTNALTYTHAGAINYHGSFKLSAAVTLAGNSPAARFTGRGTTDFIAAGNAITFDTWVAMPGGTFNFNDDFTANRSLTVFEGTLNTQNYTFSGSGGSSINLGVGVNDNSNATQTLNFGSSAIYTRDLRISGSGATVNPGTSNLYCTGQFGSVVTAYNSVTLNDVYFPFVPASPTATLHYFQSSGSITVNNVSGVAEQSGVTAYNFECVSGFTVNNTLTITGLSTTQRAHLIGLAGSVTISSAVWSNVDFQDITLQGGASGASPSGAGDCGGNSGIVFPAPRTIYRVGTETGWAGNNSWATTSSGAGSDNNFPLPQDTAVIDDNTALTGTLSYVTYPTYNHGTLDCTGRTTPLTLNHGGTITRFGSYLLSTGITVTGTSQHRFYGSGATLLTAGNSIPWSLYMGRANSSLQLQDAYSATGFSSMQVQLGTFDANNYNVTTLQFASNSSNGVERGVLMGSGLWTFTSTSSPWNSSNTSGFTLDKGTANILLLNTQNNRTLTFQNRNGPVLSFNKLIFGDATATGTNLLLYGKLAFTALESTKTVSYDIYLSEDPLYSSDITIDTWSVSGTSGNPVSVIGITGQSVNFPGYPSGERTNFKLTNVTSGIDYLIVKDIGELNGFKFAVGENSTDSGNNFNVYFTAEPPAATTSNMFLLFR